MSNIQLDGRYRAKSVEASEQLALWLRIADGMHVDAEVESVWQRSRHSQPGSPRDSQLSEESLLVLCQYLCGL